MSNQDPESKIEDEFRILRRPR